MPRKIADMESISLLSGMKERSLAEERAYDHPAYFHEYIFNQKLPKFQWEIMETLKEGHENPDNSDVNPLLILAPRNHGKTALAAESFPLWKVGRNPLEMVQVISSVISLAIERMGKIESCIRFNQRYIDMFGNLYPENNNDYTWKTDRFEVMRDQTAAWESGNIQRDATFAAFGITTSVEGGRSTLQVYDDVVSFENSQSETSRHNVSAKFWMSFDPMLLPTGQQVFLGTRFHYDDLYAELIPIFDTEKLYTDLYPEIIEATA
tara:strand:+ start:3853 stop:4644 length:792 start_codon:yes stop_codon:yes gene_type:complete